MKNNLIIDVARSGAVILGPDVVCDGFRFGAKARVQTHIHADHLVDFESSKGCQDVVMSNASYDLLILSKNADLGFRNNVKALSFGKPNSCGASAITLASSGHMLGAVQTMVTLADGSRIGYSGDFKWPLTDPIQVETLVVDSTYGSPDYVREYSQADADERLLELLSKLVPKFPLFLIAHRGTLQRSLQLLDGNINVQIVASRETKAETEIYIKHGYSVPAVWDVNSSQGKDILTGSRFIRIFRTGERRPEIPENGAQVILSAFMVDPKDPVLEITDRHYRVALSDHADFYGTLDYVRATGARLIITDNTRGGHGLDLAQEIRSRLGLEARPSSLEETREWGT